MKNSLTLYDTNNTAFVGCLTSIYMQESRITCDLKYFMPIIHYYFPSLVLCSNLLHIVNGLSFEHEIEMLHSAWEGRSVSTVTFSQSQSSTFTKVLNAEFAIFTTILYLCFEFLLIGMLHIFSSINFAFNPIGSYNFVQACFRILVHSPWVESSIKVCPHKVF